MEKRTLIALVLSFVVILIYPHVLRIFYPEYGRSPGLESRKDVLRESPESLTRASVSYGEREKSIAPPQIRKEDEYAFIAGHYKMVLSKNSGSILSLGFTSFGRQDQPPRLFLEAKEGSWGIGALQVFLNGVEKPLLDYQTQIRGRSVQSEILNEDFEIKKVINFSKSMYGNELRISYTNKSPKSQNVQFRIIAGSGLQSKSTIDQQYFESNWIQMDEVVHKKGPGKGKTKTSAKPFMATSIKDRHFSSILKPASSTPYLSGVQGVSKESFAAYIISPLIQIGPGQTWKETFLLYIGPNRVDDLKEYELDNVVNFGKLDPICKLLLGGMQMVYGLVRNYGVAIIILTIVMNVFLLPLSRASFMSMKRMQLVQPMMAKLREKYKSDAARMNKETMELYKKYKVNPMGGCLPMILQMPIFIALYVSLSKSIELLGSKLLWINDLAYPDEVGLPFSLPLIGNSLHVLPLIMIVAMVLQQKITQFHAPAAADPNMVRQQKLMGTFMPILFGFIFYPMPSGLVIYWLTNTLCMTAAQTFFYRREIRL